MMRKCHVRFGGGPGEKAVYPTSLAVYPTSCLAPASGSSSCLALGPAGARQTPKTWKHHGYLCALLAIVEYILPTSHSAGQAVVYLDNTLHMEGVMPQLDLGDGKEVPDWQDSLRVLAIR